MHSPSKVVTLAVLVLLMTAAMLMTIPVNAQEEAHGGTGGGLTPPPGYTNWQEGGSMPLPAGVTPDVQFETLAYMSFRPNPVGVGQSILVNLWLEPPIHVSHYFKGYTVTFTKPDGTKDTVTINSFRADTTAWFEYTLETVGTWKIKFDFLGGFFPAGNYTVAAGAFFSQTADQIVNFPRSVYYKPSSSPQYDLVVQSALVASWPPSPLPSDYWTRPVTPENREWWPILGNFPFHGVGGGPYWPAKTNVYRSNYLFTPWVQGPETAHIVWKRQGAFGGLYGGYWYQDSFTGGGGTPTINFMGRCYQTITKVEKTLVNGTYYDLPVSTWQCYDLRTGQVYWERAVMPGESIPSLISYEEGRPEVPGAAPEFSKAIFFVTIANNRLYKYDPYTGSISQNISIPSLGTNNLYADPYVLSIQTINAAAGQYRLINWTTRGATTNFADRIANNISYPLSSIGTTDFESMITVITQGITDSAVSGSNPGSTGVTIGYNLIGVSLTSGQILWNVTTDYTNGLGGFFSGSTQVADHGKYAVRFNDGLWHCYDLASGKLLWKSTLTSYPWGVFGCYGVQSAYGLIFSNQYDGVQGLDWNTGKTVWLFSAPATVPYESPYTYNNSESVNAWFTGTSRVADGKLYCYNTEHTATQPITRGWRLFCLNATTGENIWNITGSTAPGTISDGYLTASDTYDGYMYVFGKGKSASTVTAPTTSVAKGTTVLIQGTVMDKSPGDLGSFQNPTARTDFPQNVPCVAEESMTQYMECLHMQKPRPNSVTGVPVTLSAIKSDGTFVDIGTTTTNGFYGTFSKAWTPPDQGEYTIVASFVGDKSYGSSSAATGLSVGPATQTPATPEIPTPVDNTMLLYGIVALVVIAIIIGIIALLRKR
jgi:hypothetical protein